MNRIEFFRDLQNHDWFHQMSDDHNVFLKGDFNEKRLAELATKDQRLDTIMSAFVETRRKHLDGAIAAPWPTFKELTGCEIGILIDPVTRTIVEVEYDCDYRSINRLVRCGLFTLLRLDYDDCVFVDDEGLINGTLQKEGGFVWNGYDSPLAGPGLILGTNEEGESISAKHTLNQVKDNVRWIQQIMDGKIHVISHRDHEALVKLAGETKGSPHVTPNSSRG